MSRDSGHKGHPGGGDGHRSGWMQDRHKSPTVVSGWEIPEHYFPPDTPKMEPVGVCVFHVENLG